MSTEPLSSRRDLLKFSVVTGIAGILYGCGGNNTGDTTESSTQGRAQLRVEWPAPALSSSRYLPQYAKSLVAELTLPADPSVRFTQTVNRPDTLPATQTITFTGLPAGKTYTVKCSARVERDGLGATVALASSEVTIIVEQTTSASITLNSTIQRIEILGQPLKLYVGDTLNLTGRALDANNNTLLLPPSALTWSIVSGSSLGTLTADGKLTVSSAGTMRVRLAETVIGVQDEADIQITRIELANTVWPKFRADNQNTGRGKGSGAVGQKKWEFSTSGSISGSATIDSDGTVYFASNGILYALDGNTGVKKWDYNSTFNSIYSSAALRSDGILYIGSHFGLYSFYASTGQFKRQSLQDAIYSSPAIGSDGTIYIGNYYDLTIHAVNGSIGSTKWSFRAAKRMFSSPSIGSDGTIYILGGDLYALDGQTGAKKWEYSTSSNQVSFISSPAIGSDGTIYFGDYTNVLYAVDGVTGKLKWQSSIIESSSSSPAIGLDGTIYTTGLNTNRNNLYAIDGNTGTKKWEFTINTPGVSMSPFDSSPTIGGDGTIYIGSANGFLYAIDGITGAKKWEFQTGRSIVASPSIGSDGTIYIGSGTKLYAIG